MDGLRGIRRHIPTLAVALCLAGPAISDTLDAVLQRDAAPPGVVFEFSGDEEAVLDSALPALRLDIDRLRERFPQVPIEVVSHGLELLSLTQENAFFYPQAHRAARALHTAGIPVTVCGAYADDFDLGPEDFPDYVSVVPSAPAHRDNLQALDYVVIPYP